MIFLGLWRVRWRQREYFYRIVGVFICAWGFVSASPLEYRLSEEQPGDTMIGNVSQDYGKSNDFSSYNLSLMRFHFRRSDGNYRLFRINETNGILRSSHRIDRETVCPDSSSSSSCDIRLDVVVNPQKFFQIIKVVVVIDDINDQKPTFNPDIVSIEMSENARVGSLVSLPGAVDLDSFVYGIQRYELTPPNVPFELQVTGHRDGSATVHLRLKERLDRETIDSYYLVVTAFDGGRPSMQGQLRVNVSVTDVNDNTPIFDSSIYRINLSESIPPGSLVLTVRATDKDIGWNSVVFYSFAPYTAESVYGEVFAIDNLTGQITTRVTLQYKSHEDIIHLRVMAVDGGSIPNSAFARVIVRIVDTNDNAPQMTISTLTSSGQAEVEEHTEVGAFVALIKVSDDDKGDSGRVTCHLTPLTDFFLESGYENEYTLRTARTFDRESEMEAKEVVLTCQDKGIPPISSTTTLYVRILDINDHSPQIPDSFKVSITENNAIGTLLLRLNATDEDSGRNAELRYELDYPGGISDMAAIVVDNESGEITANVVFNYEWRRIYTQRIAICDRGDTPRCASTTLTVEVLDVNDEPPVFSRSTYYFEVAENQPQGTVVGMVSAEDADVNLIYRKIVYALRGCDGVFEVDIESGEVRTLRILDREEQPVFRATVTASNEDFPSLKTTANLVINVNDENDNSPTVIYPTDRDTMIQVPCRALPGTAVARVQATDPDDGLAGTITYFITTNSNFTPLFEIDPQTGVITSASVAPYSIDCGVHWLTVRVTDNGVPKRSAVFDIFINLNASISPAKAELSPDQATSGLTSSNQDYVILFPALVLVVVLLIVCVVSVFLLYRYCRRKQKRKEKKKKTDSEAIDQLEALETIDLNEMAKRKTHHISRNLYGSGRIEAYMHSDTESDSGCSASDESERRTRAVVAIDT